ncbi:hypothetical protein PSEG_01221 [Pseudomonas sp. Nvir]|nr:hypothetical protein PSNVIR_00534 [Pseudomonas sp. Nvir]SUD77167.1 Uncharacterised protein [Pseudomonas putida]
MQFEMPVLAWEKSLDSAGLFAGLPAPTGTTQGLNTVMYLWERASPRRGQ